MAQAAGFADDQVTVAKGAPRAPAPPSRPGPPPPPPPASAPTAAVTPAPKPTRYRTTRTRWRHPLGEVFNAVDNQTGDRVVITLLHPARKLSSGHLDAARATANVLSGIIDASINGVVDLVPYPDGRIGVVTEFLNATALSEQLAQRALPAPRVIAILRQVVRALGLAHRAGVPHGALTVGSILLHSAQGRPDAVVVTDFALQGIIAADLDIPAANAGLQPVTPERILGLRRTEREDIYLLGCLGYTMLTGSPPFRTGNAQAVQRRHAIEDPMPIEERLRATRLPPAALIDVVHRCLSKEAEDRFEDMADLEAELCLAQIDAGISTVWDDLSIPRVDETRRRSILTGLQSRRSSDSMVGAPAIVDIAESVPISVDELDALPSRTPAPQPKRVLSAPAPAPAPAVNIPRPAAGVPQPANGVPQPVAGGSGTRPLRIPQPRPTAPAVPKPSVAAPTAPLNVHRHLPVPTPALGKAFPVDASRERGAASTAPPVDLEEQLTTPVAKAWPKPAHMQRPQPGVPRSVGPATTAPVVTRGVVSSTGFSRPHAPTGAQPTVGRPPVRPSPAAPPSGPIPSPPKFAGTPKPGAPEPASLEAHLERAISASEPRPATAPSIASPQPVTTSTPAPAPVTPPASPDSVDVTQVTPARPVPSSLPAPPVHAPPPAGAPSSAAPIPAPPTGAATSPLLEPIDAAIDAALPTPAPAGGAPVRAPVHLDPPTPAPEPLFEHTLEAPVRSATMAWGGAPAPSPVVEAAPAPPLEAAPAPAPVAHPPIAQNQPAPTAPALDIADAGAAWAAAAPSSASLSDGDIEDLLPRRKPWGLWLGVAAGVAAMAFGLVWLQGREPEPQTVAQAEPTPDTPGVATPESEPPPAEEARPTTPTDTAAPSDPVAEDPPVEPEPEPEPPPEPAPEPRKKSAQRSKSSKPRKPSGGGSSTPRVSVPSGASASDLAAKGNDAFNSAQYKSAAAYLEKAVRKAPGNSKYRLLLGDTYFKQGRFAKARKQYVEADELGAAAAPRRISKVDAKLGG